MNLFWNRNDLIISKFKLFPQLKSVTYRGFRWQTLLNVRPKTITHQNPPQVYMLSKRNPHFWENPVIDFDIAILQMSTRWSPISCCKQELNTTPIPACSPHYFLSLPHKHTHKLILSFTHWECQWRALLRLPLLCLHLLCHCLHHCLPPPQQHLH